MLVIPAGQRTEQPVQRGPSQLRRASAAANGTGPGQVPAAPAIAAAGGVRACLPSRLSLGSGRAAGTVEKRVSEPGVGWAQRAAPSGSAGRSQPSPRATPATRDARGTGGGGNGGRRRPAGRRARELGAGAGAGEAEAVSPAGDAARPGTAAGPGIAASQHCPWGAPTASLRQDGGWQRGREEGTGSRSGRSPQPGRAVLGTPLALLGAGKGWDKGCEWHEEPREAR